MIDLTVTDRTVAKSACTECGYVVDAVTGPAIPREGDVSVCLNCGEIHLFGPGLSLVKLAPGARAEMEADESVELLVRTIRERGRFR